MRLINPKTNETLETKLNDAEVREKLALKNTDFARKLAALTLWTAAQRFWAHKIAAGESVAPTSTGEYIEIINLFKQVRLTKPIIKFHQIRISKAGDNSRNPGYLYLKDNGDYIGKISPEGVFSGSISPMTKLLLDTFAKNPITTAAIYGKETGECCFCGRELTDEESVAAGYGPVCAQKWGLKHGRN